MDTDIFYVANKLTDTTWVKNQLPYSHVAKVLTVDMQLSLMYSTLKSRAISIKVAFIAKLGHYIFINPFQSQPKSYLLSLNRTFC